MTLLQWRDNFSVGVPAVDYEHQKLIALINSLHTTLGSDRSSPAVEDFLGEINTNIAAHFALEEKVMRDKRYDEIDAHKASHEELLDDLRDIMDAYDMDPNLDDALLSERLGDWFGSHFRTHDARLHKRLG